MAGATQAFSEAFSSYRESVADYAVYSILMSIVSMAISLFAAIGLAIFGIFSFGSVASFFATGASAGIGVTGVGASLLALFLGGLIMLWLSSGLHGAYLATLNGFISRRSQSIPGFFLLVPKYANSLMLISIICGVLIGAPLVIAIALAPFLGQFLSIGAFLLIALYIIVAAFLLIFAMPCAVVDNAGAISAIKRSAGLCLRNFPQVLMFVAILFALGIPALLPIFNLLYIPLFYMPITASALLRLYRTAR
jgi:uncharacterized membrane protein